jgi:Zn-dependent metalloprotease
MGLCRNPLQCIIPPHVTKKLAESKDPEIRDLALHALALSGQFRGRRAAFAAMGRVAPGQGLQRTIYDARTGISLPGDQVRKEGDGATGDVEVNEAYDGLGATYELYSKVFQRDSLDGHGLPLVATVHYDRKYDNAFWNGTQMVFGDGDGRIFNRFTIAVDVIGHELTHGVTQYACGLEYQDQSGALNESFSDVFGSLVKQYALNQTADQADWLIGAGLLAKGIKGKALRSMAAPGTAYDDPVLGKDPQPANMSDYDDTQEDNGGVHLNSGIPNHAFYLVATKLGGFAWEDAGHIWYQTLLRLQPTAQFADAAALSIQVAGELGQPQQQAVSDAWDQVGVAPASFRPTKGKRRLPHRRHAGAAAGNGNGLDAILANFSRELKHYIESH